MTCFTTSELYESRTTTEVEFENFHQAETIEEILEVWRKNRSSNSAETMQQRRMENLSWRMMATTVSPPTSSITTSNKETTKAGFFSTGSNKDMGESKTEPSPKTARQDPQSRTQSSPNLKIRVNQNSSPPPPASISVSASVSALKPNPSNDLSSMRPSPSLPTSPSSRRFPSDLNNYFQSHSASGTPMSGSPRFSKAWSSNVALDHIEVQEKERQRNLMEGQRAARPLRAEVAYYYIN